MSENVMNGAALEKAGWLQGHILTGVIVFDVLRKADAIIGCDLNSLNDKDLVLIVASQSCDIANNGVPLVQFSIGYSIANVNGSFSHNKHPRTIHVSYEKATERGIEPKAVSISVLEKIFVSKNHLISISFDADCRFPEIEINSYVNWLAAHYNRPALPSVFNNRLQAADKGDKKKRQKAKALSADLLGIYAEIIPFSELPPEENYSVNLLGLLSVDAIEHIAAVKQQLDAYADLMRKANMDVKVVIQSEDKVSIATLRRFKRFYFDDLSFSDENAHYPPEVNPGL